MKSKITHKEFKQGDVITDHYRRLGTVTKVTSRSVYVKFSHSTCRANRFWADEFFSLTPNTDENGK